jgi:hypothetical protein
MTFDGGRMTRLRFRARSSDLIAWQQMGGGRHAWAASVCFWRRNFIKRLKRQNRGEFILGPVGDAVAFLRRVVRHKLGGSGGSSQNGIQVSFHSGWFDG